MRVLFILHGPHDCQSGVQVFHFADRLAERGAQVAVLAPGDPAAVARVGEPRHESLRLTDAGEVIRRWGRPPDVIHAWTPREQVRRTTTRLAMNHRVPYLVHMEDNEERILTAQLGTEAHEFAPKELDARLGLEQYHPVRGRAFLQGSGGLTVIADELREYADDGQPWLRLYPCLDADRFSGTEAQRATVRSRLGILEHEFLLVYPGNMHAANRADMFSLYLAVALLRRRGHPVRLLRLGEDFAPGLDDSWDVLRGNVIAVGKIPWAQVPEYLAAGDAFVQPGRLDAFNRLRMPAKIPEFLATGKPTVLPACNVGRELRDGEQALLLQRGEPTEIADHLERVIEDPALARRIGAAGREFARQAFDPEVLTGALEDFYRETLERWSEREERRRLFALRGAAALELPPDPVSLPRRAVRAVKRRRARRRALAAQQSADPSPQGP